MYILTDGPFVHLLSEHTTIVHPWAGNPKIWSLFICISISIQKGSTSIQKYFMHSFVCKYFPSLLLHSYKSYLVLVWTISNMQIFFFEYWRNRCFDLTFTWRFEEENLNGGYVPLNVSFLHPVFVLPSFHLLRWFYFYLIFYSHEFASVSINNREEDQIICPDLIGFSNMLRCY